MSRPASDGSPTGRSPLVFDDHDAFQVLCGERDENLRRVESRLGVSLRIRGNEVAVSGPDQAVPVARTLLLQLYALARKGGSVGIPEVDRGAVLLSSDPATPVADIMTDGISLPAGGARVSPKTPHQRAYLAAMQKHDLTVAIGPAGTGKTFLAMAAAVSELLAHRVKRIVLTRPAVEAGERLGFLPGDLVEKVNPYLRPLYDALYELLDVERGSRLIERGQIEIAPLAFMRGRTLSGSFVILDEAQNCTVEQMKMFLTRLGYNSRAVVTGDITQTDLPPDKASGLEHASQILSGVPGIAFCTFDETDVMRHPLVQRIIQAYEADRARLAKPPSFPDESPPPSPDAPASPGAPASRDAPASSDASSRPEDA
jgi:phosphate starvation-inducible PhoH-like protein